MPSAEPNGGPLPPTLSQRIEHDDDDDKKEIFLIVEALCELGLPVFSWCTYHPSVLELRWILSTAGKLHHGTVTG